MLHTVLMIVHFFCAAAIVALVLLQRGKGAEAGAGFGSGASGTVFGARGATTALSRATAILAGIFMLTSLSLAYVGTKKAASSSLIEQYSQRQPASAPQPGSAPQITITPASAGSSAAPAAAPAATAPAGGAPSSGGPSP